MFKQRPSQSDLKRKEVSVQFIVTVKEWKSQEDRVAQGFCHGGDASTREMLSSWCLYFSSSEPRKIHRQTSLGTKSNN